MRRTFLLPILFLLSIDVFAQEKFSEGYLITSDGVKIHYVVAGRGTPVVLIHGFGATAQANWFDNGIAQALAKNRRVVALDVRGHGKSDKLYDGAKYGERIWKDVIELMDHLAIKQAHFHGYSMGGYLLNPLMAYYPERFITASYGGAGVNETPEWKDKVPKDKEGVDPQQTEARQKHLANTVRDQKALDALQPTLKAALSANSLDLTKIKFPVLAVFGEFDEPNEKTHRLRRELKNFNLVILPGKSHLTAVYPGYMPKLYLRSLVDFINANDPKDDRSINN